MSITRPNTGHLPRSSLTLARGLGWVSLGLGAAEVLLPGALARAVGLRGHGRLVASYGLRELATGAGILLQKDPTPWIWGRVSGDGLDLLTLAAAMMGRGGRRAGPFVAALVVGGMTALDLLCAQELSAARTPPRPPVRDYSGRSGFPNGHPREARAAS